MSGGNMVNEDSFSLSKYWWVPCPLFTAASILHLRSCFTLVILSSPLHAWFFPVVIPLTVLHHGFKPMSPSNKQESLSVSQSGCLTKSEMFAVIWWWWWEMISSLTVSRMSAWCTGNNGFVVPFWRQHDCQSWCWSHDKFSKTFSASRNIPPVLVPLFFTYFINFINSIHFRNYKMDIVFDEFLWYKDLAANSSWWVFFSDSFGKFFWWGFLSMSIQNKYQSLYINTLLHPYPRRTRDQHITCSDCE